jgi:hypothetical protein
MTYVGLFGPVAAALSPFISLGLVFLLSPLFAWITAGRYYLARQPETRWQPGEIVACIACRNAFEAEDMVHCSAHNAPLCSLCCSLENRCHDCCKSNADATAQFQILWRTFQPVKWVGWIKARPALSFVLLLAFCMLVALPLAMLRAPWSLAFFLKIFAVLALSVIFCGGSVIALRQRTKLAGFRNSISSNPQQNRPEQPY